MKNQFVSGKSVVRNSIINLIGQGLPLVVAFFCIPQLISVLGAERFGFLTLIWVVVGYLSIFDLGLGQALTQLVAEKIGHGKRDEIPLLFWTAIWTMAGLGIIGMVAAELVVPYLVEDVFVLPVKYLQEAGMALKVAALSLPFVIVSAGTRGVLEANQRFDLVSKVRIPLGIFTFAAPLLVARYFSNNLADVALMLVVGRIAFLILTMWLCIKITPKLFPPLGIQLNLLKSLFSFGSWMTLTNLIGPMMVYLDRFVIGSLISMTAVAYYVTPYEVITKLWILPGALTGVLFSAFAINLVNHVERTVNQFRNAMDGIFLLMLPITMLAIVFANDGLTLWLGQDFADHSVLVFQILAIGVLINSLGRVPFVFIQAAGRPDIPARLHLLELPLYLFALWYMLEKWGVAGASIAWVLRIVLDNLVLFAGCVRIVPLLKSVMWRGIAMSTLPCLVLVQEIMVAGRIEKISVIIVAIVIIIASSWWFSNHWRGKFKLYAEAKDD